MTEYVVYREITQEDGSVFAEDLERVGTLPIARGILREYRKTAKPNERIAGYWMELAS